MTITLKSIRDQSPCERGWRTLTKALGTTTLTTELSIGDVVLANGLDDALWCLRCLEPRQRVAAIMPAVRRASAHTSDQRVHDCIAAVQRWLDGDDSVDLLAAWAAARAAAGAAGDAEHNQQRADLLAMFPPIKMKEAS